MLADFHSHFDAVAVMLLPGLDVVVQEELVGADEGPVGGIFEGIQFDFACIFGEHVVFVEESQSEGLVGNDDLIFFIRLVGNWLGVSHGSSV